MPLSAAPTRNAVVNLTGEQPGFLSFLWEKWVRALLARVNQTPQLLGVLSKTLQSAALGATAIPTPTLAPGLYRVSYSARVTRPATTSSSLTVTVGWTDGTVACSESSAAITGNTTGTQVNRTMLVRIDSATTITAATAYSSVGATTMQYRLDVTVELVDE